MAITGAILGQGLRAAREVAHRELIDRSVDAGLIEFSAPDLSAWAIAPDEIVNVSCAVEGWGSANGRRRIGRLRSRTMDGRKNVRLQIEDLHGNQRIGLLDVAESPMGANLFADGVGAILPHAGGGGFNGAGFFRASPLWLWDAVSQRVVRAPIGAPAVEADGLPLERSRANFLLNSGFGLGLASWSTFGVGVNGSAIALQSATDTTPLFDPAAGAGMPYSILMTAGNPHAANLVMHQVSSSVLANRWLAISFDYKNDVAGPLCYFVIRTLDGFYWNGAAFAAPVSFLPLPDRTAHGPRPERVAPIPTGGTASTFDIGLCLPIGGTASRTARVFHVQCEVARISNSRIVTGAAYDIREEADYCYANEAGRRSWPAVRGTAIFKGTPNWNTSRAEDSLLHFLSVAYDSNNEIAIYYDGINSTKDRVVATRKAAGSSYTAAGSLTVVEDVPLFVVFRWASVADGELDALYGAAGGGGSNFDVWAGSAGAVTRLANSSSPVPAESADSRFQVGGKSGECFDGRFAIMRVFPNVLSDQELLRWCI